MPKHVGAAKTATNSIFTNIVEWIKERERERERERGRARVWQFFLQNFDFI